jgi:hypothetical protein
MNNPCHIGMDAGDFLNIGCRVVGHVIVETS